MTTFQMEIDLDHVRAGVAIAMVCFLLTCRLKTVLTVEAAICLLEGTLTVLYAQDVLEKVGYPVKGSYKMKTSSSCRVLDSDLQY